MTTASTKTVARVAARLAAGAVLFFAAVNAASAAGNCGWMCGDNGTQLDGLRLEGLQQPSETIQQVSGKTPRGPAPNVLKNKHDTAKNAVGHVR